jgi:hypothetical protein
VDGWRRGGVRRGWRGEKRQREVKGEGEIRGRERIEIPVKI